MGAALLLLSWVLLGIDRPPGLGDVTDVRHWSYPDYTRVVVELDRPVSIKTEVRHLPANPEASRPERLYLDLDTRHVKLRAGDGYASLGHGMTLSLRRVDPLGTDTSLRGPSGMPGRVV